MTKRRTYGDGGIDARGENSWRLRYRVNGQRFTQAFHGTLSEARKELRRLIRSGDVGEHVAPDKMTLAQWIDHWISIGAPGNKRRREVGQRTVERYAELLRCHVVPVLGPRPLQQLQSPETLSTFAWPIRYRRVPRTMFIVCSGLALAQPLEPGSWSAIRCWNWRRSAPPAKPITAPLWTRISCLR